jgi:hypothetical protein
VRSLHPSTWHELYELNRLTCPPANIAPRYNIALLMTYNAAK